MRFTDMKNPIKFWQPKYVLVPLWLIVADWVLDILILAAGAWIVWLTWF